MCTHVGGVHARDNRCACRCRPCARTCLGFGYALARSRCACQPYEERACPCSTSPRKSAHVHAQVEQAPSVRNVPARRSELWRAQRRCACTWQAVCVYLATDVHALGNRRLNRCACTWRPIWVQIGCRVRACTSADAGCRHISSSAGASVGDTCLHIGNVPGGRRGSHAL